MASNALDEVYRQWRTAHQDRTGSSRTRMVGYRQCATPGCPTSIESSRQRMHCFFHGGKPDANLDTRWTERFKTLDLSTGYPR